MLHHRLGMHDLYGEVCVPRYTKILQKHRKKKNNNFFLTQFFSVCYTLIKVLGLQTENPYESSYLRN